MKPYSTAVCSLVLALAPSVASVVEKNIPGKEEAPIAPKATLKAPRQPAEKQPEQYVGVTAQLRIPNPVSTIGCGYGIMVIEHGSPGDLHYSRKEYHSPPPASPAP